MRKMSIISRMRFIKISTTTFPTFTNQREPKKLSETYFDVSV